jgi:trehalose utilization protein
MGGMGGGGAISLALSQGFALNTGMRRLAPWFALLTCLTGLGAEPTPIRVLVWDERQPEQRKAYDGGFLGDAIAKHLAGLPGLTVKSVGLDSPEQGLGEATLAETDVVIFWCHKRPLEQDDVRTEALVRRVMAGKAGFVALHSAHWAKPFVRLMQERAKADAVAALPEAERANARWEYVNEKPYRVIPRKGAPATPHVQKVGAAWRLTLPQCVFPAYRADGAPSHVATLQPTHPLAAGLPAKWDIPQTEMYGEPFWVPAPDSVVFEEKWDKGEHFRSGALWKVGQGDVLYFRPGHETYPVFRQAENLRVLENAVRWMGAEIRRR